MICLLKYTDYSPVPNTVLIMQINLLFIFFSTNRHCRGLRKLNVQTIFPTSFIAWIKIVAMLLGRVSLMYIISLENTREVWQSSNSFVIYFFVTGLFSFTESLILINLVVWDIWHSKLYGVLKHPIILEF